jgi:hypothetical protein
LDSDSQGFTTGDRITGFAIITCPVDTPVSGVSIDFVGTSQTTVDRSITAAADRRTQACHRFLRLSQPDLQQQYPSDSILRAGKTHKFPFEFVVPEQLLPLVCRHPASVEAIRDYHLQLPPSLSDNEGNADDATPTMADIQYEVSVKLRGSTSKTSPRTTDDEDVLASKSKSIWVVPRNPDMPPVDTSHSEYVLQEEKTLKDGSMLLIEAVEPQPLQLESAAVSGGSALLKVALKYIPGKGRSVSLPTIDASTTDLKVTTYYRGAAQQYIPSKTSWTIDPLEGRFSKSVKLLQGNAIEAEWSKQQDGASHGTYYTTSLMVPMLLPAVRRLAPTFHSCLISRVYKLKLRLKATAAGSHVNMELQVPLQISSASLVRAKCHQPSKPEQEREDEYLAALLGEDCRLQATNECDEPAPEYFLHGP